MQRHPSRRTFQELARRSTGANHKRPLVGLLKPLAHFRPVHGRVKASAAGSAAPLSFRKSPLSSSPRIHRRGPTRWLKSVVPQPSALPCAPKCSAVPKTHAVTANASMVFRPENGSDIKLTGLSCGGNECNYQDNCPFEDGAWVTIQGWVRVHTIGTTTFTRMEVTNSQTMETPACYVGGCSSQVCSANPNVVTTCEYLPEYACLQQSQCGNFGANGSCAAGSQRRLHGVFGNALKRSTMNTHVGAQKLGPHVHNRSPKLATVRITKAKAMQMTTRPCV